jgi:hypothetical protein
MTSAGPASLCAVTSPPGANYANISLATLPFNRFSKAAAKTDTADANCSGRWPARRTMKGCPGRQLLSKPVGDDGARDAVSFEHVLTELGGIPEGRRGFRHRGDNIVHGMIE